MNSNIKRILKRKWTGYVTAENTRSALFLFGPQGGKLCKYQTPRTLRCSKTICTKSFKRQRFPSVWCALSPFPCVLSAIPKHPSPWTLPRDTLFCQSMKRSRGYRSWHDSHTRVYSLQVFSRVKLQPHYCESETTQRFPNLISQALYVGLGNRAIR